MILMDMPMPESCGNCPCSYQIRTGEYEGMTMCNALEFKDINTGYKNEMSKYFVVEEERRRPDNCPMILEIHKRGKQNK